MSAYKHTPFPGSRRFTVSRCIGTCLRTHPPIGGTAPGRAKYTQSINQRFVRWVYFALNRRGLSFWRIRLFLSARIRALFHPHVFNFQSFFSLFTLPCSQTCEQTFVNKAQNIFKVNFYSKGNSSFSSTFMNPSGSFFGRIRFHER